jgi:molybdopterin synthase sulfur carrier subunit
MEIAVRVPTLLHDAAGGQSEFGIEAATLDEALRRIRERYPLLRIHLYEESGRLRPHVLIFYNEQSIAWLDSLDLPLHSGDRLDILQATSGG